MKHSILLLIVLVSIAQSGCATIGRFAPHMGGTTELVDPIEKKMTLARLSEKRGIKDRAKALYLQLVEEAPENPIPHHRLGVLAAKEGKYQEAMPRLESARRLDPENLEILNDFGYALYLQNQTAQAEVILRQVVAKDPYNERANNNLAMIVGDQGRFDESFAHFKKVGNVAEAHANIGYLHAMHGNFDQSLVHYDQSLNHDKDLKPAAEAMISVSKLKSSSVQAIASTHAPAERPIPTRLPSIEANDSSIALVEFIPKERHSAAPISQGSNRSRNAPDMRPPGTSHESRRAIYESKPGNGPHVARLGTSES